MLTEYDDLDDGGDICRVCRSEGTSDRPLFHPCICTGSIKFIHQECLMQWMKYSRKEYCELCRYKFSFTPIYSPNMPRRLPITDILSGIVRNIIIGVKFWVHYSVVALAWLGIVPLIASRTFKCLFSWSFDSIISLPVSLLSTEDLPTDIFHGSFIVTCTLFAFIGLVWLREQILNGGAPNWLDLELDDPNAQNNIVQVLPLGEQAAGNRLQNVNQQHGAQGAAAPAVQEDNNWNPIEWDRAADELTLERLLGLDGSLVFLEHVFWVISLNTLFLIVFAFFPYSLGYYTLHALDCHQYPKETYFEGFVTTFCGYVIIATTLFLVYFVVSWTSFNKIRRLTGLAFLVLKVSLLLVVEIGMLPLVCGWWLDICSLGLFDVTLKDRKDSYSYAPSTSMFIHWLVGMVFVYYFASFILLLREVLRPGVLWFLRNLNDPDFSPVQEMIHLSGMRHLRRLMASSVIFGASIMLVIWIPSNIIKYMLPSFLPFIVTNHLDSVNELSLELLLLQVVLPALLEQSYVRNWLKLFFKGWCLVVAWILDMKSYLLGNQSPAQPAGRRIAPAEDPDNAIRGGLGAAHQALLQRGGPVGFEPYTRPNYFSLRLGILLVLMAISLVACSVIALVVPVAIGRQVMVLWPLVSGTQIINHHVHELYTASAGMYVLWLIGRAITLAVTWVPRGRNYLAKRFIRMSVIAVKSSVALFWVMGVIPLLCGVMLDLVIIIPIRVPVDQTPVIWMWQDWALGVLYSKICAAVILMGPENRFRRAVDRTFRNGFRRLNLAHLMKEVVLPVTVALSLTLAIPYVIAYSFVPMFTSDFRVRNTVARRLYPFLMFSMFFLGLVGLEIKHFINLYNRIKNEKYLVGRRLVNYDHRPKRQ